MGTEQRGFLALEDEILLPASVVLSRLRKHREVLRAERDALPWYRWGAYARLSGAIAAYEIEWEAVQVIVMGFDPDDTRSRFERECG